MFRDILNARTVFSQINLEISEFDRQTLAEQSARIALVGGMPSDIEERVIELGDVAGVKYVDVRIIMDRSRRARVLGQCRKILREGRTLGDVGCEARTLLGRPVEGILRKIVVMATHYLARGSR